MCVCVCPSLSLRLSLSLSWIKTVTFYVLDLYIEMCVISVITYYESRIKSLYKKTENIGPVYMRHTHTHTERDRERERGRKTDIFMHWINVCIMSISEGICVCVCVYARDCQRTWDYILPLFTHTHTHRHTHTHTHVLLDALTSTLSYSQQLTTWHSI